ncbi:MAG: hypothetical protein AAGD05_04595 [Bacteroidota bacterium]
MNVLTQLQQRWQTLLRSIGAAPELEQKLWQELVDHYGQAQRKYHNFQHLQAMFTAFDRFASEMDDPEVLQCSIWFHDIIYRPTRKDNEEKSAAFAQKALQKMNWPVARIQRCCTQIRSTQKHLPSDSSESANKDEQYLIDFDLEILSRTWAEYQQYSQQIRAEYWIYPGPIYRRGRKAALQQFLSRSHIYWTPLFRAEKETKARANFLREIEML